MLTKGTVEKIEGFKAKVRLPIYDGIKGSADSTQTNDLSSAIICSLPNTGNVVNVGDIVIVGFEDNDTSKPIILGHLYKQEKTNTNIDINARLLTTNSTTKLSKDTFIGNVLPLEIQMLSGLKGNIQQQINILNDKVTNFDSATSLNKSKIDTIANNYLPLTGGQLTGKLSFRDETSVSHDSNGLDFILGINSFVNGGTVKYTTPRYLAAGYLYGFDKATLQQTWGNQTGSFVSGMAALSPDPNDPTNVEKIRDCDIAFRKDNPNRGQLSLVIDGTVYVNEGNDEVATKNWTKRETVIDASALDQNTWYPVIMRLPKNKRTQIEVYSTYELTGANSVDWTTHNSKGFVVNKVWTATGSGWGTSDIARQIWHSSYNWCSTDPVRGVGQCTQTSDEYVFVRGGGIYTFNTTNNVAATLYTTTYQANENQSVSPTTSTPSSISSTVTFTGTINANAFNATSDRRLKENIVDYYCDKSILDLPIKEFDYINSGIHTIGCIAQDLQNICPEIVSTNEDGFLYIQESKIVYLLLQELKQLKQEVKLLKGE